MRGSGGTKLAGGMRAPRTIRARLTVAAAGTILAAVVLFAVATVVIVDHELHSSLESALRERAEEVAQLAVSTPAVLDDPGVKRWLADNAAPG